MVCLYLHICGIAFKNVNIFKYVSNLLWNFNSNDVNDLDFQKVDTLVNNT